MFCALHHLVYASRATFLRVNAKRPHFAVKKPVVSFFCDGPHPFDVCEMLDAKRGCGRRYLIVYSSLPSLALFGVLLFATTSGEQHLREVRSGDT